MKIKIKMKMKILSYYFAIQLIAILLISISSNRAYAQPLGTMGETNLLQNPSFEEIEGESFPGWKFDKRTFSPCTDFAKTGKNCLKFVNTDPNIYDFCNQSLTFKPGEIFYYSCWIKTENIQGEEQGATLCIQWVDKSGKYIGGSFPFGLKGTNKEWTLVSGCTPPIPPQAAKVTLSLYCRQKMTGTAWFDEVTVRKFYPSLFSAMTTNCYRNQTTGGSVRVFVGLNGTKNVSDAKNLQPKLAVITENKKEVKLLTPTAFTENSVEFHLNSTDLSVGIYKLCCRAINPKSGQEETLNLTFTRLDTMPARKAYIDEHRRFILDGKPFFPLGLYFGGVSDEDLALYSQSAFNCIMPYPQLSRNTLDKINAKNIKVIYSVKDIYKGTNSCKTEEEADEKVRQTVSSLIDHPAIIAWYINDEYPLSRSKELVARRNLMETLDPGRPTWAVLYQIDQIRSYIPTFDVVGTDPYPLSTKPIRQAWDWSDQTNKAVFGQMAFWQVPQIFDWSLHKKDMAERKQHKAPTQEEMRAMYWMGIAGGANGLIAYCWHDLKNMDKEPFSGPRTPLIRKPFKQSWSEVSAIGNEVASFIPVLLSIDEPIKIIPKQLENPLPVGYRVYGQGDKTWMLLVNLERKPVSVSFETEKPVKLVDAKLGTRKNPACSVLITDKTIQVKLEAIEPLFLCLEKK